MPKVDEKRPAWGASGGASRPVRLKDVSGEAEVRRRTGIAEFDRVLGGGVVDGSLVLLGGDPGIGKSTLLLAALDRLARDGPVLYVSGEECLRQTKMRAERLRVESQSLHLFAETDADRVLARPRRSSPRRWWWTPSRPCTCRSWATRRAASPRCARWPAG